MCIRDSVRSLPEDATAADLVNLARETGHSRFPVMDRDGEAVSYTHLRAHETVLDIVCRLLLEKKKLQNTKTPVNTLSRNTPVRLKQLSTY